MRRVEIVERCYFCDSEIYESNRSSEHIIHQALGGLLESEEICCKQCNSSLGTSLDANFTKIFASITESFDIKTTRKKSLLKYEGIVVHTDENGCKTTYKAKFKGTDIQSIFDIHSNKFVKHVSKSERDYYKIENLEFNLSNDDFVLGFKKIAFNYAVMCGIHPSKLDLVFDWEKREFKNEKQGIIPFIPMNYFDERIELYTENDLIHSLILFNFENSLCAYIDLFNTFQYYVLLSESYDGDPVYKNYCQRLEKRDFNEEKIKQSVKVSDYKDAHILSMQYGIPLNNPKKNKDEKSNVIESPFERIEKEAFEKIRKQTYEIDFHKWVYEKSYCCDFEKSMFIKGDIEESSKKYEDFSFYYIDEIEDFVGNTIQYEEINLKRFRIFTIDRFDNVVRYYPNAIINKIRREGQPKTLIPYFMAKIHRLSEVLMQKRECR